MVCSRCNAEVTLTNVYCNNCGQKLNSSKIDNWKYAVINDGFNSIVGGLTWDICQSMGFEAYKNKQYYEALEYYDRATKFKNSDQKIMSTLYNDLAITYQQIGDKRNAMHYYDLAILSDPNNFSALSNRAGIKIQLEDGLGAIKDIDVLINNSKMKPHTWFIYGAANEEIGFLEKARQAYERAIAEGFNQAIPYLGDIIKKIHNS